MPQALSQTDVFLPRKRGKRGNNTITWQTAKQEVVIRCYEALDVNDLDVLLALLRLAANPDYRSPLLTTSESERAKKARNALDMQPVTDTLVVRTTKSEIVRLTGKKKGGTATKAVDNSLARLSAVSFIIRDGGNWMTANLLSLVANEDTCTVALHPTLANTVLGGSATQVDMSRYARLQSDVARKLCVVFSAQIQKSTTRNYRYSTLIRLAYGNGNNVSRQASSKRKQSILQALEELQNVGFGVWTQDDLVSISMPEAGRFG